MSDITWSGASNGGTLSTTGTGATLTPSGTDADPALFGALVPVVPNVPYALLADLAVTEDWPSVAVFAAYFDSTQTYAGSGVYPAGQLVAAGATAPADLVFTVPGTGVAFVQAIVQLTGTPPATTVLTVTSAELAPVPAPAGTVAVNGILEDGAGLVSLSDYWSFVAIINEDPDNDLFVTTDGSTAEVDADDVSVVHPASMCVFSNGAGWYYPGYSFDGTGQNPGVSISMASDSPSASYSVMAAG